MSDRHYVHHHDEVQLAKILKESRPWLEQYGTTVIYGLAAVVAVAAVAVFIARRPPATAEASRGLLLASTPEDFQAVADESPDSQIGILARLKQAEFSLSNAVGNLFTNREVGLEELKTAETTYDVLAARNDIPDTVRQRVLVGLARIAEARCNGNDETTRTAVTAWEKVLKDDPDSTIFKEMAEERIKKLPLEATRSFYAWFQQQNPKPGDDLQLPQDGPGTVPDIPKFDLDSMLKDLTPATSGTTPAAGETPAATAPATAQDAAAPAASDTPAAPTPAETTPETPAETPPAAPTEDTGTPAPATEPPAAEPSTPETPATEPPASEPPASEPPASEPPAEPTAPPTGDAPTAPEKSGE